MSNLPKVLIVLALSMLGSNVAMADWQADAANLSSNAGIDTASAINSFLNDINKFQPPTPCVDTNQETFTMGTPAALNCGSGSGSGGSGGGAGGAGGLGGGSAPIQNQESGSGQTFDHM